MKQFIKNPIVAKYMAEKYPELAPQEPDMIIENPKAEQEALALAEAQKAPAVNPFASPEVDLTADREAMKEAYRNAAFLEGANQISSAIGRTEYKPGKMTDLMVNPVKTENEIKKQERDAKRQKNQDDLTLADRDRNFKRQDEADERTKDEFGRNKMKFDKEMQNMTDEENPDSQSNRVFQQTMSKFGPEFQSMTISDYKRYGGNILKLKQDAQQLSAQNEERRLRRQEYDLNKQESQKRWDMMFKDKVETKQATAEAKKVEAAKPSDKQIESFTDFDNATSDLNNLLAQLGNKSNWTGPVDGRIPDLFVGEDQVAWRSAVGKYKDAYRKAITGAGAGPSEIARLETRLPSENDTLASFQSKAQEALKELERRRSTLAGNLTKAGKNVKEFAPATKIKVSNGKETFEVDEEDLAEAEADGFKRIGR